MATEEHSEPTVYIDNKIGLPQWCAKIRHVWIWENFQTPPEGPRAGLKDSQITYPCIGVVVPLPNQNQQLVDESGPRWGQIANSCEASLGVFGPKQGATRKADRSIETTTKTCSRKPTNTSTPLAPTTPWRNIFRARRSPKFCTHSSRTLVQVLRVWHADNFFAAPTFTDPHD